MNARIQSVSESYVQKIIWERKATNCRTDPIPSKLIKKFKEYFTLIITTLINLSLRSGTLAKDWKSSTVRSLIKNLNLSKDLKNYRSVNNLCVISKYVEKAMLEQLNTYMTTQNLLPDYILAYRKNFSTETVLVKIHHDILKAFEEQKGVLLTGLDLSAAFETVDNNILIIVLENIYGIGGLALEWFKDYLRNGAVQVLIGNSVSEAVDIPFSVPQGSCAGPVLYNTYSSTVGKLTQGYLVNLLGYADDKTLYDTFNLNNKVMWKVKDIIWTIACQE